ncbi:MAG TPA: sigma 54-interacting transcriptional regulator [Myxococcales bacterium]|jgi:transcriptional regulator with PAS, ATPase and Fis domain
MILASREGDCDRDRPRADPVDTDGSSSKDYAAATDTVPRNDRPLEVGRSKGLADACRELNGIDGSSALFDAIPRLALELCGARGGQLLEIDGDGEHCVLARHGVAVQIAPNAVSSAGESVVGISIARPDGPRLMLVLEIGAGAAFAARDLGELEIFTFMAASALARASLNEKLHAAQALETAVVGAVHDAVIVLDSAGIVRSLSASASTLIGQRKKDAIGKRLRELPGMAPLALAVLAGDRSPETVRLAGGEVRLRLRRCPAGLAVTLLPDRGSRVSSREGVNAARYAIEDLLGESAAIQRARETAQRVADVNVPILITGETGTGKEILAQAIHNASPRANEPFVGVNVSAIPRELLESELFGYEPGAFTGASSNGNPGKFGLARSGTLLLDEVGEMPLEMQAKLLRVLQERVVHKLGSSRPQAFTARVIASTNRDLEAEVAAGRFRLDLLHRLRVVHLELPPLRDRPGDIRLLVEQQLRVLGEQQKRSVTMAPHVLEAFEAYAWPGNVRELINVLEGEISMMPWGKTVIDEIPEAIDRQSRKSNARAEPDSMTLESAESAACARALEKADWNVALAAQILGVVKATLYAKMRRYNLGRPKPVAVRAAGGH